MTDQRQRLSSSIENLLLSISIALPSSEKGSWVRFDLGAIEDAMLSAWPERWELDGRGELGKSSGESIRRLDKASRRRRGSKKVRKLPFFSLRFWFFSFLPAAFRTKKCNLFPLPVARGGDRSIKSIDKIAASIQRMRERRTHPFSTF